MHVTVLSLSCLLRISHWHPKSTLFPYTTLFRSGLCTPPSCRIRGSENGRTLAWERGSGWAWERYLTRTDFITSDRKSTRLNSSHLVISYAVFCLKKKININSMSWLDRE